MPFFFNQFLLCYAIIVPPWDYLASPRYSVACPSDTSMELALCDLFRSYKTPKMRPYLPFYPAQF